MAIESPPSSRNKRKYYDANEYEPLATPSKAKKPRTPRQPAAEKRLRRFRAKAPVSFSEIYNRATTQRFYVITRTRTGTHDCPEEIVEMTGSTGNIYTVVIARQPTCDCPHAQKGNQCKHWLYVMSRVLHARYDYIYQLALLSTELQETFAAAPPPVEDEPSESNCPHDKRRKAIEGDCPICFEELEAKGEALVWCKAACGQNIHKQCFEMWAATKRQAVGARGDVTCPYCRSVWHGDEEMVKKIKNTGEVGAEGYVNVADQLGISTHRDTSTYSSWGRVWGHSW